MLVQVLIRMGFQAERRGEYALALASKLRSTWLVATVSTSGVGRYLNKPLDPE